MRTYSHLLMTAAANRVLGKRIGLPVREAALLLGSFVPDIPLGVLTIVYLVANRLNPAWMLDQQFDKLYFTDPVWIIGHNLLHSPVMILFMLGIGYFFGLNQHRSWGIWLFWFAVGCGFHSAVDILTHHSDGPLLFFPFDWQTRFQSPISYWDRNYGGQVFTLLEYLLDLGLLAYLFVCWVRDRHERRSQSTAQKS